MSDWGEEEEEGKCSEHFRCCQCGAGVLVKCPITSGFQTSSLNLNVNEQESPFCTQIQFGNILAKFKNMHCKQDSSAKQFLTHARGGV